MKFSETKQGRVFVIRLEDGDILHEEIEKFARDKSIKAASLIVVGGADAGSKLIVGPEVDRETPITPMEHLLERAHEVSGAGTIFPDDEGHPILHMHIACGRKTSTVTGCVREGVKVWNVMEVILYELLDSTALRVLDKKTGFKLLAP
ncbi:MAG: DNA-binding protein [Proteobacteria bacterium]|nr:DNA-binding protein [Pseudomonadota bacterium]